MEILNDLIENETLFDFLFTKKYQDIREFANVFDDLDSNRLKIKDVEDLEKVVKFVEDLKNACYNKSDDNFFINTFIQKIDANKFF